jgi:serine/threonine protein kinase/Flp pilus assembly protein TadD
MTDRWHQAEDLYHAALERPANQRSAFLLEATGGDDSLRQEVESLLSRQSESESLIESPGSEISNREPGLPRQAGGGIVGKTISHYRVIEKLGAGGMGVVYRAHDVRLDRDVALKVLPAGRLAREAARNRFHKEALALAKLNQPHIGAIYDFDSQEGVDFLVMEYVPGTTLAEQLASGPLPESEVCRLGAQIVSALEEAHQQGIVHRDLKPGNIVMTPKGQAKVLDFGLAKLLQPANEVLTVDELSSTALGVGTLPYMAPEQLRGAGADARTDIYSAGAVLYEMATGQRPFPETQGPRLIDSIFHQAPQRPSALNRRISPALESLILKALDKDPERRHQSAKELVVDLNRLRASTPVAATAAPVPRLLRRPWLITATALALVVVTLIFVLNAGGLRQRLLGRPNTTRIESLAVLPLDNLSHDPDQEYFAEGLTEALIGELSQISALRVISRTSAMQYKGTKKPLKQIAAELHVDGLVEGSVQRSGDRVRITAELIYAQSDTHLWARSYDFELRDVLTLESNVARAIADEIQVKLTSREKAHLTAARQVNPAAYEDYLQGRYEWNKRTAEGLGRAIEFFEQAISKDPRYALAYAGLADSQLLLAYAAEVTSPVEAVPKARAAALKALTLDETLAEAHAALGAIRFFYDWDWSGAEMEFNRAIELKPGYATAHHWYGLYLEWMGRITEATAELQRAQQLDPLSLIISVNVSSAYYVAGDHKGAVEQLRKTLELDPSFWVAYWNMGEALIALRQYSEAIADLQKAVELSAGNTGALAVLGYAYAVAGERGKAEHVLQELTNLTKHRYISPMDIAYVEIGLGNKDQAFAWMEKAYQERSRSLVALKVDPLLDPLRSDPRFQNLLRRMHLSK